MIEQVELHNFKSHRSTQLNFDDSRLHALVGQNSSGKTSVLEALYSFSRLTYLTANIVFKGQHSLEFIATVGQEYTLVSVNGLCHHDHNIKWSAWYRISSDPLFFDPSFSWTYNEMKKSIKGPQSSFQEVVKPIYLSLRSVYLKLTAINLSKADYSEEIIPQVKPDGSGLAPTLDYLRGEVPERFQSLQEMLQRIVPGVQKIGVRRAKVKTDRQRLIEVDGKSISYEENQEVTGQEVVLDMNTGDRIPAHSISEGTMITLGLLTVLMSPNRPKLVLLDDIEQGLHPNAQRELVNVLKDIIKDNQDLQIIFSTHSPYIVDELAPSQVHVLSNSNGYTYSKRLDEHPDVEWAKQTLTTGEFWDAEGEDWVTDGADDA
jgi:predicted ATPase